MTPTSHLERSIRVLATVSAFLGGGMLSALVLLTVVSITGRGLTQLGLGPVPGDTELMEAGIAFAVFSFMPLCQLQRGHAKVDLFAHWFGKYFNILLDLLYDTAFVFLFAIIGWRMWLGMLDKKAYAETTFILQVEIWPFYGLCLFGVGVTFLVGLYQLQSSFMRLIKARHVPA